MEYVPKINIFGLKMMVKSGLGKIILKFLHVQNYFFLIPPCAKEVISITEFAVLAKIYLSM